MNLKSYRFVMCEIADVRRRANRCLESSELKAARTSRSNVLVHQFVLVA